MLVKLKLHQGEKKKIWQLTSTQDHIREYVHVPVFFLSNDKSLIETEVEAWVVPKMNVLILLGEDHHLNYQVDVVQSSGQETYLKFENYPFIWVKAEPVNKTYWVPGMIKSVHLSQSFVKAKEHRQNKNARLRCKHSLENHSRILCAKEDVKVASHSSKTIEVKGYFDEDIEDWAVEQDLLSSSNHSYFLVPNVIIQSSKPWIPISNASDVPRILCKGEIVTLCCRVWSNTLDISMKCLVCLVDIIHSSKLA